MKYLLFIFIFLFKFSYSQSLEFNLSSGYAFKQNAQKGNSADAFIPMVNVTWIDHKETEESVDYSLGKGVPIGFGVSYRLNQYLAFGINANYLITSRYYSEFKSNMQYSDYNKITLKGTYYDLNPNIKFGLPLSQKLSLEGSVGINIALPKVNYILYSDEGDYPDETQRIITEGNLELSSSLSVGFDLSLGAKYQYTPQIAFEAHFSYLNIKYSPKNAEFISYTYNGTDYLDRLSNKQRYIEFVDNPVDAETETEPLQMNKYTFPFHSLGINIGLIYTLNFKKN